MFEYATAGIKCWIIAPLAVPFLLILVNLGGTTKHNKVSEVKMGYKLKQSRTMNSRTDFFYYMFRNVLLFGVSLLIISGLVLSHLSFHSSATSSNSGTDNLAITISTSCTLGSVVNAPHSKEVYNGNYETNIGKTTITTLCNDGNGYSIYANGYSNNEEGNNKLINSTYPQYSIDTGLATSGLTSTWAMKLNNIENDPSPTPPTIDSSYNDTYGLVPTQWTKVAYRQSGTTDMSQGSSFTTTYAVYASSSQYAGTYVGQVKYALLHPYKNDSAMTFDNSFALRGKNKVLMEGTTDEYYTMQDMTSDICNSVTGNGETTATQLVDIRDSKLYWVAKLADGNCWMTQNLDFAIGSTNVPLTSENTDISTNASGSGIYASGYTENNGVWTWNPASTAITSGSIVNYVNYGNNTVSNWTHSDTAPASAEGGDTYFYTSDNNNNDKRYDSLELCEKDHTEADCMHYHVGNYYNYTAAIASNASNSISADTTRANNSICPRGWRLPYASTTDNSYNEFGRLFYNSAYNITNNIAGSDNVGYKTGGFNALRTNPLWFVRSGYIDSGTLYGPTVFGFYWSSTVASGSNAYRLYFGSNNINPASSNRRYFGWSIRCVAR